MPTDSFTSLDVLAFGASSPSTTASRLAADLGAAGLGQIRALGCAKAGDFGWYVDQAPAGRGFVVLVPTAREALRAPLAAGVPPLAALAAWRETLTALLARIRRNRDRACLLTIAGAEQSPGAAVAAVGSHFGLDLRPLASQQPLVIETEADPLADVVGLLLPGSDAATARLTLDLEASALPVPEASTGIDAAITALRQHQAGLAADLAAAQAERDQQRALHLEQLDQRDQQLALQSDQLDERDRQLAQQSGQLEERDRRLALQLGQLAQRDRTLAEARARLDQIQAEAAAAQAGIAAAQAEIAALRSSTSWRITGPIRRVKRLFSS